MQLIFLHTVLDGISEEHEPHGDYARFHIVVLKLLLHKLLHLCELGEILVHRVVLPEKVSCTRREVGGCHFLQPVLISTTALYQYWELACISRFETSDAPVSPFRNQYRYQYFGINICLKAK